MAGDINGCLRMMNAANTCFPMIFGELWRKSGLTARGRG
jgi:hypothetical protein